MSSFSACSLKISQLRAFLAVVEYGNFSTAALELGLSQSTISHAIATLEAELGVILLNRGRHGALLTPIGDHLLPEVRQIFQLMAVIQHKADLTKGLQSGQVRVGCVRSLAAHIMPTVMAQFQQRFPGIAVRIMECDRYLEVEHALREGMLDLGLTCLPAPADFEVWELFQDEFVALLPNSSLAPDAVCTWDDLMRFPIIMNPLTGRHHTRMVRDHLAHYGHTLTIAHQFREDSTVLGMVKQGLGISVMPRLTAEPIPDGVQVKSLPVPLFRSIGAVILSEALIPQAAFVFLDCLKATLTPTQPLSMFRHTRLEENN